MKKNIVLFSILGILLSMQKVPLLAAEKSAVLWCDPLLNVRTITSRNGIISMVNKARNAGFEAIAIEVKTSTGEVIYESKIAPRLAEWKNFRVPLAFDAMKTLLAEARRQNLQVYAVFSIFAEGNIEERQGPIYQNHPQWSSKVYVIEQDEPKIESFPEWGYGTIAYANPFLDNVQNYEISVVKEFLSKYSVDGIIFDKARFYGIEADFSESAKSKFEAYLGNQTINWWPADVYELKYLEEQWQIVPGEYFQDWIAFRSQVMHDFLDKLTKAVKSVDQSLPVGNFVGGWYPTYYEYGVNWASKNNYPDYNWATDNYNETAIAELFDFLVPRCFFPRITMDEAEKAGAEWWMSVEGSATNAKEVVDRVCPIYGAILVEQFKDDAGKFKSAFKMALNQTGGLYVTDYSYVDKYKYWDELREVLLGQTNPLLNRNRRQ